MVVVGIFTGIFAMILTVLTNSDQSFRVGQDKLAEQQEARKAMDGISGLLRQSNPAWVINGTSYPVAVSEANTRIDFYRPVFDANGNIASLKKITFKLDPSNNERLLKKEGTADEIAIAHNISYLNFGAGCAGCGSFNCASVAEDCPAVSIDVRARKKNEFALLSQVSMRNQNVTLSSEVEVEEPQEGEF
jgi:hypothetical protein